MMKESAFTFLCGEQELLGILHEPEQAQNTGVLIVVGGPQYRIGSHRQFVLLARHLASSGIPVMRFDYRAMGDSEGDGVDFEKIGDDMSAALEQFSQRIPQLKKVVLWGLCDAASAILQHAHTLPKVKAMVLLNPWVRTEEGQAKTFVKHYYAKRILQFDMWKKVLKGQFDWRGSLTHFFTAVRKLMFKPKANPKGMQTEEQSLHSLPDRMLAGFERSNLPAFFILSGANDFVAEEFRQVVADSKGWQIRMAKPGIQTQDIPEANHTFSTRQWRKQVEAHTLNFLAHVASGK